MLFTSLSCPIPDSIKYTNANRCIVETAKTPSCIGDDFQNIFSKHPDKNKEQVWTITRFVKQKGKSPKCKKCSNIILLGQLHVVTKGLYIPFGKEFAVSSQFRFCPDKDCLNFIPTRTNIEKCGELKLDPAIELDDSEIALCMATGKYNG